MSKLVKITIAAWAVTVILSPSLLYSLDDIEAYFSKERPVAVDGDTAKVPYIEVKESLKKLDWSIRLSGIDTPELNGKCEREKKLAATAKSFVSVRLKDAKSEEFIIKGHDKYGGRLLGEIILDGKSLNQELIEKGLAVAYDGGEKTDWCNR